MELPKGKVVTVLGPVEPSALGTVLTHEHLSDTLDDRVFVSQPQVHHAAMSACPFTLENLWWIRQFPYSHPNNLVFHGDDVHSAVLEEMRFFKSQGGGTVVENTCRGMGRDIPFMRRVASLTGLHVVAGTGYYVTANYTADTLGKSIETMSQEFTEDITEGADGTDSRCGVLGELGCSWPLRDFEKNVLRAAAGVQEATGCPAIIHPGRDPKAPFEIVRIFAEAGGNLKQTVMSHLDHEVWRTRLLAHTAQHHSQDATTWLQRGGGPQDHPAQPKHLAHVSLNHPDDVHCSTSSHPLSRSLSVHMHLPGNLTSVSRVT
ncbi:phosphotriesterase-related protein isoform X2 [Ixodes scapularis]|uniref:phosphotriesterase-related protein isoform X2 n=1 Tax=Ixodes scapularis TaxID=6945 RepID=UPI001A9FBBE6|nr:phosphotriesterase-related protein isoform X2 [Ixodes scapularis]